MIRKSMDLVDANTVDLAGWNKPHMLVLDAYQELWKPHTAYHKLLKDVSCHVGLSADHVFDLLRHTDKRFAKGVYASQGWMGVAPALNDGL